MTQLPGERIDGDVGVCFRTGFPKAATHTYTDFNKTYKPITREAGKMAFNGLATHGRSVRILDPPAEACRVESRRLFQQAGTTLSRP